MGTQRINSLDEGRTALSLSGEYGLADAVQLGQDMLRALDDSARMLELDMGGVERADLSFFQLLFSLAAQARLDGKCVVLELPLPEPLRQAAGELGLTQRDFEQAFNLEVCR